MTPPIVSNTSDMEMEISTMRKKFLVSITKLVESKSYNSKVFSKEKYFQTVKEIKEAKEKGKKSSPDYRHAAKYDMISVQGTEKLIEATHEIKYGTMYIRKSLIFFMIHISILDLVGRHTCSRSCKENMGISPKKSLSYI